MNSFELGMSLQLMVIDIPFKIRSRFPSIFNKPNNKHNLCCQLQAHRRQLLASNLMQKLYLGIAMKSDCIWLHHKSHWSDVNTQKQRKIIIIFWKCVYFQQSAKQSRTAQSNHEIVKLDVIQYHAVAIVSKIHIYPTKSVFLIRCQRNELIYNWVTAR